MLRREVTLVIVIVHVFSSYVIVLLKFSRECTTLAIFVLAFDLCCVIAIAL